MHRDYIIVGQGLAGSLLSYFLIRRHCNVVVYDDPGQPKSSTAAAGIFNPFTGRRLTKTWLADQLFPFLMNFYKELEQDLKVQVLHLKPMYRPFLTADEQNEWGSRLYDNRYNQYIDSILNPGEALPEVKNPLGGIMLKRCGYVNTNALIAAIRGFLISRNALVSERFSLNELQILKDSVIYQGCHARKVIFCEGPWLNDNSFFNWLPLKPVKGELLEIELEKPLEFIVNRKVFVLPYNEKFCKVGATFDNRKINWSVTDQAKFDLTEKLNGLLKIPYKIRDQIAGVRPATLDRRPLIGLHPECEPLAIFNGLGTKGISLAPYLVQKFWEFLDEGKPLMPEVTISRYFSLYYNKI